METNTKSIEVNGNSASATSSKRNHMELRFVDNHLPENNIAAMVLAATCAITKEETVQLLLINETATMAFGFVESHVPESLRLRVLV